MRFRFVSRLCTSTLLILCVVLNMRLLHGHVNLNESIAAQNESYGDVSSSVSASGGTDHVDGFPRIPICKWASLSNFLITHSRNEGRGDWRELMEMIDDADELSGDISRPGASESMLREAVVHFSQVISAGP